MFRSLDKLLLIRLIRSIHGQVATMMNVAGDYRGRRPPPATLEFKLHWRRAAEGEKMSMSFKGASCMIMLYCEKH